LKRGHPLVPDADLNWSSRKLSQGAVEGLRILGVNAEFQPINDIQVEGKKVSGAAGSIRWGLSFIMAVSWWLLTLRFSEESERAPCETG